MICQHSDLSAADGQLLAPMCVETLQNLRSDKHFDAFWDKVMNKSSNVDVNEPTLPRRRKAPKLFKNGPGKPSFPESIADMFRQHDYEALDLVINSIKDGFD